MEPDSILTFFSPELWIKLLLFWVLIWLNLVRFARYQRARDLEKKYAPLGRESFRNMTADDAQAVLKTLAELEFPSLYGFSMVVALFRVRSISFLPRRPPHIDRQI